MNLLNRTKNEILFANFNQDHRYSGCLEDCQVRKLALTDPTSPASAWTRLRQLPVCRDTTGLQDLQLRPFWQVLRQE